MNVPLSPYVRRAWYSVMEPGFVFHRRVIFDYELLFVKAGRAEITIDRSVHHAEPGDLFLFRPRQPHSIYIYKSEQFVQPHIHFDLTYSPDREYVPVNYTDIDVIPPEQHAYFRQDILNQFYEPFPSYFRPHNASLIEQMMFDIIHAQENPRPFNEVHLAHHFLRLWEQLLLEISYAGSKRAAEKELPLLIKQLVEQNDSRAIRLEEVSRVLHFSKSYISRVFQEQYGISLIQYHTTLRIQKAKQMIRFTNLSLSEISAALGFGSLQDFSRAFKKVDGSIPSAYRKNVRPKSND